MDEAAASAKASASQVRRAEASAPSADSAPRIDNPAMSLRALGSVPSSPLSLCARTGARCGRRLPIRRPVSSPLFNGRDLTGWHGMPHIDPAKLAAMSAEERAQKRAADDVEFREALERRERRAGQRRQRPVCHDRRDYGDIELRSSTRPSPRPTAASTCAARRRCRSGTRPRPAASGSTAPTRARAACGTTARRAGQGPAGARRQAVRRVEQLPHRPGRRAHEGLAQRQAGRRRRPDGELLGSQGAAAEGGPIQLQTHGGEIRWRNVFLREMPAAEATTLIASRAEDGFERSSTART